ncbi:MULTISPECIES: glycosyltransferase family A protein [Burkholderiaceae]|uniref:glycosyltransferase family 2 protein n=1 Tax=Burkholderiaceae TaxID=119060 RepID=UPI00095D9305|nr:MULTISPECIES: glycosyltransferase family A protein [Burkholderiaceae]MCF2134719.1 glycosyltransferase family 2 protein [Mycetohabitans sp. B3]MCG1019226.1 glycosyltransferase family 2 protein [Mycetohabitans sp. B4]MCG1040023.1 glycosyltransferase family 2 protein [Mycetohabitans sp. B7]SIT72309.1 Glycosyltransferase, GT2 family [Burkholderia sp. b14]SIT72839.1 Glycosyltransferase, GT2 family [Burkholderia sp. b13]
MPNDCVAPTVAVIIPFYNGSKWIERALVSVTEQTVLANEVFVVNDGSRVDEQAALYELSKKYHFCIIDKPNGGQGSARNAGVEAASSEYICFLDQDDFYLHDHIEVLVHAIPRKDRRFGFVYGDAIEADGNGNIVRTAMIKEHNPVHPKRAIFELLRQDMFVLPSASLISRKAFLSVGGFDSRLTGYEDDDLFLRIFRKGYTNYFVDRPVYVWCIHSESTSYTIRMSRSRFLYFQKLAETFGDEEGKQRFYFRDCLVPRFGKIFIVDAFNAVIKRSEYRHEVDSILRKYASMVYVNPHIGIKHKVKLWMMTFFLTSCPPSFVSAISIIAKLPAIRRLLI